MCVCVIIYLCLETKSGSVEPRRRPPSPLPEWEEGGGAVNSPQITTRLRCCNLFQLTAAPKEDVALPSLSR